MYKEWFMKALLTIVGSPLLLMKEEGMQLFAYDSFENLKINATMKDLVEFHRINKFLLQSKDEAIYRKLGKIVGNHDRKSFTHILDEYEFLFKPAIAKKSSKGKTRNVLDHMSGFFKKFLDSEEKAMLHEQIDDYASGRIPLGVPLNTLKLYASKYKVDYILQQRFITPYPKELGLRSNVKCVK